VTALSEYLAENNPGEWDGFMTEFFKAYEYIEDHLKPITFQFLRPWTRLWVTAPDDSHPEFIDAFTE
jgi:hypothetical protein